MQVQVDALSARIGGGLSYIVQQLGGLVQVRPDWGISVLAAPWNEKALRSISGVQVRLIAVHSLAHRLAFEQGVLPLLGGDLDVLYCPGNFAPLASRTPCVVTQQNPNYFGRGRAIASPVSTRMRIETMLAKLSIRKASAVLVISQSLREEMERDGLWTSKCQVVLSGAPVSASVGEKPDGLEGHSRFLLSLANDYPHKRLDDLVHAWSRLLQQDDPPSLVIAGGISPFRIEHQRSLVPPAHRARLLHMGAVDSPPQVRWLLENAIALVITSELEAFPLTPAEAGDAGCPLVLTDIPPHREVTENRGHYFGVGRIDDLASRIVDLLVRPPSRERWRWPVSWEQNAEELARLLEGVASAERG